MSTSKTNSVKFCRQFSKSCQSKYFTKMYAIMVNTLLMQDETTRWICGRLYKAVPPLTLNLHMPPMSSLLSKQTGSKPSSTQILIQARPELPAPTTAARRTITERWPLWGRRTESEQVYSKRLCEAVLRHHTALSVSIQHAHTNNANMLKTCIHQVYYITLFCQLNHLLISNDHIVQLKFWPDVGDTISLTSLKLLASILWNISLQSIKNYY